MKENLGKNVLGLQDYEELLAALADVGPECLQLVPLLQLSQLPPDFVEQVGALKAAAVAIEADDNGAEAADQNGVPVHMELLRHHLAARRTVPVENRQNHNHVSHLRIRSFLWD